LIGADGMAHNSSSLLDGKDLLVNDLAPGQKASGRVVFDVPAGAEKQARIGLTNPLADGDAGYWQLP